MKMDRPSSLVKAPLYTDEEKAKIAECFNDGYSLQDLADMYPGRTRGAMAGLLYRIRQKNGIPVKARDKSKDFTSPAAKKAAMSSPPSRQVRKKKERIRLTLICDDTMVTFAELDKHHCKFPIGDPKRSDFRFCGKLRLLKRPYCHGHTAITETRPRFMATPVGPQSGTPQ